MIGGLFLAPFAWQEKKREGRNLTTGDYFWMLLLGILCIPLSMLAFQLGIMHSNASTAAVLFSVNPLFTIFFASMILKEKITANKAIALTLGIAGIVFMIRPWDIQEGNSVLGVVLMISASLIFGLYTVTGKLRLQRIGLITQTSISFILGSLVLLIVMLFMKRPVFAGVADNLLMVLYIGVFVTGFGYYFYFMAIRHSDASTASMAFFIKPAIAPIFAVIFLKDILLWNTFVGIGLIVVGSFITLSGKIRLFNKGD
jgi:drug/metabolite transporter (DMT)-like permease